MASEARASIGVQPLAAMTAPETSAATEPEHVAEHVQPRGAGVEIVAVRREPAQHPKIDRESRPRR